MQSDNSMEISVISTTEETVLDQSILPVSRRQRFRKYLRKCSLYFIPRRRTVNKFLTKLLVVLLFCGSMFGILGENALPGSEGFALFLLAVTSYVAGKLTGFIRFPPLLGMLVVGFLFRNLSVIPYYKDISPKTASVIRDIALVVILLSSGLGLDGIKLKNMKMIVVRLTLVPLIVEACSMAVFAHYFLELPWIWGMMLGFVTSAVSVAVVLPILMNLKRKKLGTNKGIPTLILAASSMDDIVAIAGFTVTLSIVFSQGNLTWILIRAPLEPLVGCVFGAVLGVIFWHFPTKHTTKALLIYYNVLLLSFGGLSVMFISNYVGIHGSGSLSCISLGFVTALKWRKDSKQFDGVESVMSILWEIIEPFMFALIGAEVSVTSLRVHIGYSVLALILALICRAIITPFITFGANLNVKEKVFICCAWIPKATVQAAIGSQALDRARLNNKGIEFIKYGEQILTVSVLSILITAPLGAVLTTLLGPLLLSKEDDTAAEEVCDATDVKQPPLNYGSFHHLQPSDILPPKAAE